MFDAPTVSAPLVVTVPGLRIRSEMNTREHWAVRYRRGRDQMDAVALALRAGVPYSTRRALAGARRINLKLVRVASRKMDRDNLAGGFKAILDAVCRWLGIDDGDEERLGVEWSQEIGETAVRIEFATGEGAA